MVRTLLTVLLISVWMPFWAQEFNIVLSNNDICVGDTVTISTNNSTLCDWTFGEGASPDNAISESSISVVYNQHGVSQIVAESPSGYKDTSYITVYGVMADFDIKKNRLHSYKIDLVSQPTPIEPVSFPMVYTWNLGDGTSTKDSITSSSMAGDEGYISALSHTYDSEGTYTIELIVKNNIGCADTTSQQDTIVNTFSAPNVFTPNQDGMNDFFTAKTNGTFKFSMIIYSRWGNIVYQSPEPSTSVIWNGKLRSGNYASTGTYYYVVTPETEDEEPLRGFFHLFRGK